MSLPTKNASSASVGYSSMAIISCVILMVQNCASVLVIRYSRQIEGPQSLTSWIVVLAEILKVLVCCYLSFKERYTNSELYPFPPASASAAVSDVFNNVFHRSLLYISVPGILYAIQNNLLFYALSNMEAVFFSLLSQFKIVTTAFFSVLLLDRKLSNVQWFSLLLLLSGICFVQYDSSTQPEERLPTPVHTPATSASHIVHHDHSLAMSHHSHQHTNSLSGLLATLALTITSAIAGVYFEKIVKGLASGPTSMWISNIQLGLFGCASGFLVMYSKDWDKFTSNPIFYGFNYLVILSILIHALGGLLTAAVVKYADNILKSFATSFSMVLASLISWYFLDIPLSLLFFLGATQVVIATHLYSTNPSLC